MLLSADEIRQIKDALLADVLMRRSDEQVYGRHRRISWMPAGDEQFATIPLSEERGAQLSRRTIDGMALVVARVMFAMNEVDEEWIPIEMRDMPGYYEDKP